MKLKAIKKYNLFIAFLIAVLGFGSACKKETEVSPAYGSPSATYKIYGKIISADGTKIPAIRVIMQTDKIYSLSDSMLSDSDGNYLVIVGGRGGSDSFQLKFEDIDGAKNGNFQMKDTTIKFVDPEFINGGFWYLGETSKKVNIKLEEEL